MVLYGFFIYGPHGGPMGPMGPMGPWGPRPQAPSWRNPSITITSLSLRKQASRDCLINGAATVYLSASTQAYPRKIGHQLNSSDFSGNLGFRTRDWFHWIRLEILCYLVVFMCPELRYRPGSGKNGFWDPPFPKQVLTSMLELYWVHLIFRPRGPKPYFPALGPFKTGRGRV